MNGGRGSGKHWLAKMSDADENLGVGTMLAQNVNRELYPGRAAGTALALLIALAVLPGELSAQSNIIADAQPGVSGVEKVGETLTADRGSMANHVTAVRGAGSLPNNGRGTQAWSTPAGIRWQRLDAGTWTTISDTNRRSYTLQTDDLGKQVRVHFWRGGYDYVGVAYPVGSTVRAATVPSLTGMTLTSAAGTLSKTGNTGEDTDEA